MKRIFVLLLCTVLLCSLFAGCTPGAGSKTDRSGKDIAKLLLANSRLNAEDFAGGLAFLPDSAKTVSYSDMTPNYRLEKLTSATGNDVSWSGFTPECNAYTFFESYFVGIEAEAERFANLIDEVKNNCRITDYWVEQDGQELMLKVDANTETIYVRTDHSYSVCRRYTDSNARDVYEMYCAETASEISIDVQTRMLYIPQERYEFSLTAEENDMNVYIVAEKDRGYWNMFQVSDMGSHANIMNLVDTGNVTFTMSTMVGHNLPASTAVTFSTSDLGCDIVGISEHWITLNMAAFNGVDSIQAPAANTTFMDGGTYALTTPEGALVTTKGIRVENGVPYANETVQMLAISAEHNADTGKTSGRADLQVQGQTPAEQFANLKVFLSEVGLSCKYNLDAIAGKINSVNTMVNEFMNYYTWNGCAINSYSDIASCIATEKASMDVMAKMYDEVKNAKKAESTEKGFSFAGWDFAAISNLNCGNVIFADGSITVEGMSLSINDTAILDQGQNYTICLALARLTGTAGAKAATVADHSYGCYVLAGTVSLADLNEADYDNAVILPGEGMKTAIYDGGSNLMLSQSATFALPDCTETARYTVVAYVATEDGIRVSQMLPIAFNSEVEQTKSHDGLKTRLYTNDEKHLMVDCALDVDVYITATGTQESYTADEMHQLLLNHALNNGLPVDGAQVEVYDPATGTGQVVQEDSVLSGCVCRMAYVRHVEGREIQGYIYLDLTT